MRIVDRLVIVLGLTTTTVMVVYAIVSLEQREALLRDALIRETETLARATQIVAENALRDGRVGDLDGVLARIADDPETLVAAVVDRAGRVTAGGPSEALECLRSEGLVGTADHVVRGWNLCGRGARWVALPLAGGSSRVVLGRRARVLERDVADSRLRIGITTLLLAAAAAGAIVIVLRRTLTAPLTAIMRGVRTVGGPLPPEPITVPTSSGELRDLAVAFNEMTERLEGKRRALVRETEERIALDRRVRASEKFAALGRLTGGIAHELGSPLNAIAMRAEAVEAAPAVPYDARRQAAAIVREVDRIADLIRGLTHIARRHPVELRPLDVGEVARAAVDDVRERAARLGVRLGLDVGAGPHPAEGDATLLRHALANLLLNGIQAAGMEERRGRVHARVDRVGGVVRVVIEDDGPGIPDHDRSRLFEPFFTTRDVAEGMGLGLAISQGIAEEHGGELSLEPREGGGVRVILSIPVREPTESA